jgi:hypothetical protein
MGAAAQNRDGFKMEYVPIRNIATHYAFFLKFYDPAIAEIIMQPQHPHRSDAR